MPQWNLLDIHTYTQWTMNKKKNMKKRKKNMYEEWGEEIKKKM